MIQSQQVPTNPSTYQQSEPTPIPTQWIGPLFIKTENVSFETYAPLATYETPLWASTNRGAKATRLSKGIYCEVLKDAMTRSILLEAPSLRHAQRVAEKLGTDLPILKQIVAESSHFAQLKGFHSEIVGRLLFLRFEFFTADASGHNMVTKASDHLIRWICKENHPLRYISISGNMCTDKKVSAINGILGRGKHVVAEVILPKDICQSVLKTTPQAIHTLHVKKNLVGSILAGSLRSANAHFANALLALYLATGQDAANIVEGSQGIVHTDILHDGALYFSISLPNLIVGTIGNGKHYPNIRKNLTYMGCQTPHSQGADAQRLAKIIAATVLCSELSLLAAQTNPGELMQAHEEIERRNKL